MHKPCHLDIFRVHTRLFKIGWIVVGDMLHSVIYLGNRPAYIMEEVETESDDVECEQVLQHVGKHRPCTMSEDRMLNRYRNVSGLTKRVALSGAKFGSVSFLPRKRNNSKVLVHVLCHSDFTLRSRNSLASNMPL